MKFFCFNRNKQMDQRIHHFERTKLIGTRAEQIAGGASPKVDITGVTDPLKIAMMEYKAGVLPIVVQRKHPDGKITEVRLVPKKT